MRIREGAKPSPILREAKALIQEVKPYFENFRAKLKPKLQAVEKLDAAIDISEGEFKPLWLEVS